MIDNYTHVLQFNSEVVKRVRNHMLRTGEFFVTRSNSIPCNMNLFSICKSQLDN